MGAQNIVKEIKQYQKKWLQHAQRNDTNILPKQTLQYKPKGRRDVGRPRKRWMDQIHLEDQGTGNTPKPSWTWWWWWRRTTEKNIYSERFRHSQSFCWRFKTFHMLNGVGMSKVVQLFDPGREDTTMHREVGNSLPSGTAYHPRNRQVYFDLLFFNTLRTGLLNCLNSRSRGLTFRHRASCI